MSDSHGFAAPGSGSDGSFAGPSPRPSPLKGEGEVEVATPPSPASLCEASSPSGEGLDPEIAALLEFEAVPRKVKRPDGWTAERQREFVHRLALCGVPSQAADQMGKNVSGIEAIYRQKGGESLRQAWDAAIELWQRRAEEAEGDAFDGRAPGINVRWRGREVRSGLTIQQMVEADVEDERRANEAMDRISAKLLRCRRLYLHEIADVPGKRAAFEILADFPVDWDKARRLEGQADEPFRKPNMRRPDMLLTAENGWMGEMAHGPDKRAELRRMIDEYRAAEGMEPVRWGEDED